MYRGDKGQILYRSEICILAAVHVSSAGSAERTDKFAPKAYETSLPAEPAYTS